MTPGNGERRPLVTDGAAILKQEEYPKTSGSSISPIAAESMREALAGAYCVLVVTPRDTVRRRVFLSLHAAEKHAQRAEQRGCVARLMLCRLDPVSEVQL